MSDNLTLQEIWDDDKFFLRIKAHMAHPNDNEKREGAFHNYVHDESLKSGLQEWFTTDAITAMKGYKATDKSIVNKGTIAGKILQYQIAMQAENLSPSLNKAIYLAQNDFVQNAMNRKGQAVSIITDRRIEAAWEEYKTVSNLWLAFHIILNSQIEIPDIEHRNQQKLFLLALANSFSTEVKQRDLDIYLFEVPSFLIPRDFHVKNFNPTLTQSQKKLLSQYTKPSETKRYNS